MDRRAFLASAPTRLFRGVQALLTPVVVPTALTPANAAQRVAILDVSRCLAWGEGLPAAPAAQAGSCQLCYLRCPLRDRAMVLEAGRPVIVTSACDGCGVCVDVCRTVNDLGAMQMVTASFAAGHTDNLITRLSEPSRLTSS